MIVLDTHVLVWWVAEERRKLSRKAAQALEQHGKRGELLVSSIRLLRDRDPRAPADRFIAATSLAWNAALVTQDERLRKVQSLQTIW